MKLNKCPCRYCGVEVIRGNGGTRSACDACKKTLSIARHAKWRENNRDKTQAASSKSHMKKHFNITPETYLKMIKEQHGCCAVCGKVPNSALCIDHCHLTDKIRGLLCRKCNAALGLFNEDIATLHRAVQYLIGSSK